MITERNNKIEELEQIEKFSIHNKDYLLNSVNAGCYHCGEIYKADSIKEFVRSTSNRLILDCAICPKCGIDSVLPDNKVDLNTTTLINMKKFYFR